jgi:hypothetical protein
MTTTATTAALDTLSKCDLLNLCRTHSVTPLLGAGASTLRRQLQAVMAAQSTRPAEPTVTPADLAAEEQAASGMSTRELVMVEMEQGTLRSMGIACKLAGLTGVDTTSGGAMRAAITAWLKPRDTVAAKATATQAKAVQGKHNTPADTGKQTPEVVQPNAVQATVDKVSDPVRNGTGKAVKCYVQSASNTAVFGVATVGQMLTAVLAEASDANGVAMAREWFEAAAKVRLAELTATVKVPAPVTPKTPAPVVAAKQVDAPKAAVLIDPRNADLPKGPISYDAARGLGVDLLRALATRLGLDVKLYSGKGFAAKLASAVSKASKGLEVKATPPAPVVNPASKCETPESIAAHGKLVAMGCIQHAAGTVLVADGKGGVRVATVADVDAILAFLTK